jgi:DNA-binding YbaB/EbfC family protein
MKVNNMMKQAQKMHTQMMKIQEKLAEETVESNAGGGMVKAVFTGTGELLEVKIDPEVIKPEDAEMLEDLVLVAVNDGIQKSKELANSRMNFLTDALGSLGLGGGI